MIQAYLKLARYRLSFTIAFSTLTGYLFFGRVQLISCLASAVGVFLLSCAASAINQVQEKDFDRLMERTLDRPVPMGQISPLRALLFGAITGIIGLAALYFGANTLSALLGALNLLWYNAVYTPFKRKTAFSVIIGAPTGAIPPMIGWVAAGGAVLSPSILAIAAFMFIWQIPHFLLLLLKYGPEYEKAGFPSVTALFSKDHIKPILFIWLAATSAMSLLFPLWSIITNPILLLLLFTANAFFIGYFFRAFFRKKEPLSFSTSFRSIHLYQGLVLLLLVLQSFHR